MPPSFSEYARFNPVRHPEWRWYRAHWLLGEGWYFSRCRDDDATGEALHFIRACEKHRSALPPKLKKRFAAVQAAKELRDLGGRTTLLVESRLLAGQTMTQIEELTGVPAEVVDTFESIFFNVRDRLSTRDWIAAIIRNADCPGIPIGTAWLVRYFAYIGGPLVLDGVLPYLLDGKDLFEPAPDLSTAEGRTEQAIRLCVLAQVLPDSEEVDKKLIEIMLILREMECKQRSRRRTGSFLAENIDQMLAELPADMVPEHVGGDDDSPIAAVAGKLRELAKTG